jgi:hypothetical protein
VALVGPLLLIIQEPRLLGTQLDEPIELIVIPFIEAVCEPEAGSPVSLVQPLTVVAVEKLKLAS